MAPPDVTPPQDAPAGDAVADVAAAPGDGGGDAAADEWLYPPGCQFDGMGGPTEMMCKVSCTTGGQQGNVKCVYKSQVFTCECIGA